MTDLAITCLATDCGFTEGPVQRRDGTVVVGSIDRGVIYRITPGGREMFADLGGGVNGLAEGADGTLYVAQMGSRRRAVRHPHTTGGIQRVFPDGSWTWLTQDPISPNDLCFGPDGMLYWTDPTRGRFNDGRLWRMCLDDENPELLTSVSWYPNGIAFGPEEDAVYIAVYMEQQIVRFPMGADGLGEPTIIIQMERGHPDGLAFDAKGQLIVAANSLSGDRGQIQTWTVSGELVDVFEPGPGTHYTNIALNGDREMVITYSDGEQVLLATGWPNPGLPLHPFRTAELASPATNPVEGSDESS
jgi:gluconolactonase